MSYETDLKKGKVERSNLEANKEFLLKTGVLKKEHKILEIGCGAGSMTAWLHDQGYNIIGTDMSDVLLGYAKKHHPECRFMKMSGDDLKFDDGSFDIVLSFDVLEHMPHVNKHVKEVRRVLTSGGHYLFQTPNKWTNLPYCILKDRSFTKWKEYHPSLQTRSSLSKLFNDVGSDIQFVSVNIKTEYFKDKFLLPLSVLSIFAFSTNFFVVSTR